jgi:hypothetical protein
MCYRNGKRDQLFREEKNKSMNIYIYLVDLDVEFVGPNETQSLFEPNMK